ncbi:MAG: arginine repressor [Muribaculaceae bacterium]|nr:arginine repressor [Roseburia sp.]MCM1430507.1 arginine repressor [Muribaculaceae bacterium]MCM1493180.1 arginine repressor [Muribaculaceae bacterium]
MKTNRQNKILELIRKHDIETQEELLAYLTGEGFQVTQATVSRDIRDLKLTKVARENGRQKYAAYADRGGNMTDKYVRVLREGFVHMDAAGNILVIHTVSGMASAVGAAVDAMELREIIGSIAGDDTLMCVVRSEEDAVNIMRRLHRVME